MYSSCSHLGTTVSSSKNSWTHIRAQSANGPMHSPPRGVPRQLTIDRIFPDPTGSRSPAVTGDGIRARGRSSQDLRCCAGGRRGGRLRAALRARSRSTTSWLWGSAGAGGAELVEDSIRRGIGRRSGERANGVDLTRSARKHRAPPGRAAALELALFDVAASFERFEILLDQPTRPVDVNDAEDLLLRLTGLSVGEQDPLDRFGAFWDVDFVHVDDVDLQTLRKLAARVRGAGDR